MTTDDRDALWLGRSVSQLTWASPKALQPDARAGQVDLQDGKIRAVSFDATEVFTGSRENDGALLIAEVNGQLRMNCPTHLVVPGLIDIHRHGALGVDAMQAASDPDVFAELGRRLVSQGVTAFLATTVSASIDDLVAVLEAWLEYADRRNDGVDVAASPAAICVGVHLEGPFLNPARAGAQNPASLVLPSSGTWRRLLATRLVDALRMVTLAPELPGALELIEACTRANVVTAAGHTEADWNTVREAQRAGLRSVAHLFNAMAPLHHRRPGVVGAGLLSDDLFAEIISDGHHVAPEIVRLYHRVKPVSRRVLVTDAISAAGSPDGQYELGGLAVTVSDGIARLPDDTLAGSTLGLDAAVRNYHRFTGCEVAEALRAVTANPAALLNDSARGTMGTGTRADLVVLDTSLEVVATIVGGRLAYLKGDDPLSV